MSPTASPHLCRMTDILWEKNLLILTLSTTDAAEVSPVFHNSLIVMCTKKLKAKKNKTENKTK